MKIEPFIETVTGRKFYFLAENPGFEIEEIGSGLSKACRYTGQCLDFYSVAEHSLLVSQIMETWRLGDPFEGLVHDASEAYLSDVAGPAKFLLPDYKALEAEIEGKLKPAFGLPVDKSAGCEEADKIALIVEGRTLLPSKGALMIEGGIPAYFGELADQWIACHGPSIECWDHRVARVKFLERFHLLRGTIFINRTPRPRNT